MFTNKREIFSFRKYKAYGLASAVIAAFFLAGGVASADEVTAPATPVVAQAAPSEAGTEASTTASSSEALPAVTSATPAGTAVASTETAVDGATYASDTAKQAVREHLAPLAQSTTPAPTAAQIYKENPADASKLTSDDRAVEAENKEAFDKLPDAVRRRVKSVTIEKKENGNLGHTASISGNVTMNAQYFHNDGKDGETEVLYHEIGHAIDGATYKRGVDGSDYSLSRDAAVQPLIHKAYPGQFNYEGWASMFGTYMLQKTGQREIKTDLDREINQYFSALMVGFTESETKLHGDFVITGTNKSEKHLVKADQKQGAYLLQGTYTFSASGTETITGAKLVYESSKQFLEKPEFDVSVLSTGVTDKSDSNTWRYEFALSPIGGTTVGQMTVKQRSKGMIWSGPTSTEPLKGIFKIVQNGIISDTDAISVTTDRVKSGLYRSDRTPTPTNIRGIASVPTESMIGIHQDGVFSTKDSANFNVALPTPAETWYLWNRDDANVQRDYERYTDFKYSISGIPDYLELDPTVESNEVWSREGDKLVMHLTPSSPFNGKYYTDYQPRLRLKTSALNEEARTALIANTKRVYLTWRTDGVLSDGSTYTQELPDPNGILLKTRNASDPLPEGTVVYTYGRTRYADPLREKSDHGHETFNVMSTMTERKQIGTQVSNQYYYVHIPKDQAGDRFTYFAPLADRFGRNLDGKDAAANSVGITLTSPFEVYGVEADGSTTKLGSWDRIDKTTKGVDIKGNYQKLLVKAPIMKDIKSSLEKPEIYSWGATVNYAVDDARWQAAVQDPTVKEMINGLRTDFVRTGNSLEAGARVEQKALTQDQINQRGGVYVHDKNGFKHELRASIRVNDTNGPSTPNPTIGLGDKTYLGFYGELGQYYQYLRGGGQVSTDRLDTIEKAYTSVLVPDGVSISNARLSLTNEMTSGMTSTYGELWHTKFTGPVQQPVSKIVNYKNTGKTLYVYEAPRDQRVIDAINDLAFTQPGSATQPSVEMTFDFTNNGSIPVGSHEIEYATIWDKRSELIAPVESQTLTANAQTLDDVLPTELQDGFSDKKVSVMKVPFNVAYKNEYGSRLYLGYDQDSATESSLDGVHLGSTVVVQSRSVNFSPQNGTLTDVVVSVPKGQFKTELVEKIADGANYKVLYTTDTDVKNGTYGEAPSDLSAVTAVRYKFNSPLTLKTGDAFITNMKVRVPENAPTATPATSQLFTSANGTSFLDGNTVSITTTRNLGNVIAYYVDTQGHTLKNPVTQIGLNKMTYQTTKPAEITYDGFNYAFKEIKAGSDAEQGQYVVDETKQVTYVYEKDTRGSVYVRHQESGGTGILIVEDEKIKDHAPGGEAYTTKQLDDDVLVREVDGLTSKTTTHYVLTKAPDNANGTVIAGKDIWVVYEYDFDTKTVTNGSVIATYKDTEGNELAPQVNVHTNVEPGTKYTTEAKTFDAKVDTVDGFTRTTTYTLVETPANATGSVQDGTVTTVPYVYRKNVKVNGSVVATYKDREGNELAPNFTDFTNVPDDTAYSTPAKVIPNKVETQTLPEGLTKTITTSYKLVSTPTNDIGNVEGGKTILVPYVYDKTETVTVNGSVIATYKDTEGNELAPQENVKTNVSDGEAYTTSAKTVESSEVVEKTPEGLTKRTTTSYELTETPANAEGHVVGGSVTTVPYVYRKNVTVQTYGSVIATYKDEDGTELASPEKVATNVPGGTYYAAADKPIQGSAQSKVTPEGRTVTITTYELIKTPDNETGEVRDGEIIEVPYVYRKHVEERLVPGNTPTVEIPELKVTQYQTEDGVDVKASEQGFVDAPNTIEHYQFTGTTNTNDSGDVQTHIYKLIETEVPNDAPQVDVPVLNVTRYVNEEGTEIKDAEEGHVPAPSMIGDTYQFTGRTETTEDGTVQTHVYKVVEHEVPNDAPKRLPEELQITRFVTEDGKDIAPIESGIVGERPVIGDYQYTGRSTHEEGIHTHYYKLIEHDVPNDAPQVDVPALNVTRYVNEGGSEIKDAEKGLVPAPSMIGDTYEFTGRTETTDDGTVQTHVYKVVEHQVPGDAPQVDVPKLLVTRFVNETGDEIESATEGFVDARPQIGDYEFTGVTKLNDGKDVQTHVYRLSVHEVPNEAPVVDVPELSITRHVDEFGNDLTGVEKGRQAPKPTIREYQYTDRTTEEHGITTHFYAPIKHEVPNEAPIVEVPELTITRHVNEKGDELLPIEEGSNGPRKTIGDYEYTGRTDVEGGITTHFYAPIKHEVPNDAPIVDVPELMITRHVDEFGNDLTGVEKGRQAPKPTIREYQYTDRTTEEHGITTHVYMPIRHEVPGDAPVVDVPALKVTRYINEKGEEIKESETGFIDAPKTIGEYEFTGTTELNDGKDVQTHIYKLVDKPVTPTPDPKKPETPSPRTPDPKAPETPQLEAPKSIETPKSNDSIVESSVQSQFVENELPKTGERNSNLVLVGVSLLTALGLIGFVQRKREN